MSDIFTNIGKELNRFYDRITNRPGTQKLSDLPESQNDISNSDSDTSLEQPITQDPENLANPIFTVTDGQGSVPIISTRNGKNTKKSFAIRIEINGHEVGGIQELTFSQKRNVARVRHFDIEAAGKSIDMAPGLVDGSLTASRVVLRQYILQEIYQQAFVNLEQISNGFEIVLYEKFNSESGHELERFFNCWISSISRSIQVGRMIILENVSIEYQDRTNTFTRTTEREEFHPESNLERLEQTNEIDTSPFVFNPNREFSLLDPNAIRNNFSILENIGKNPFENNP